MRKCQAWEKVWCQYSIKFSCLAILHNSHTTLWSFQAYNSVRQQLLHRDGSRNLSSDSRDNHSMQSSNTVTDSYVPTLARDKRLMHGETVNPMYFRGQDSHDQPISILRRTEVSSFRCLQLLSLSSIHHLTAIESITQTLRAVPERRVNELQHFGNQSFQTHKSPFDAHGSRPANDRLEQSVPLLANTAFEPRKNPFARAPASKPCECCYAQFTSLHQH